MDNLETLRKEVEAKYNVVLDKNALAMVAVALQLMAECLEDVKEQNLNSHKAVVNELQKLQATLNGKGYSRLNGVNNPSNAHPS